MRGQPILKPRTSDAADVAFPLLIDGQWRAPAAYKTPIVMRPAPMRRINRGDRNFRMTALTI